MSSPGSHEPADQRHSRYAVPVEDLDGARVAHAQQVVEVGDPHRPPPPDATPGALGTDGGAVDGDGD